MLARDIFLLINVASEQKNSSYAAADSSSASTKTRADLPLSKASSTVPAESKESLREKPVENPITQDPAKNSPIDSRRVVDRPLELGNGQAKGTSVNTNLRSDEGKLTTGDLRTGADVKSMGSLRTPGESSVSGSLRPDERSLPTGSLRPEEGSLPTGNLR